jgi:hypothetical protein
MSGSRVRSLRDALLQLLAPCREHLANACTFACARLVQVARGLAHEFERRREHGAQILLGLTNRARPAQEVERTHAGERNSRSGGDLSRSLCELVDQRSIDVEGGNLRRCATQVYAGVNLAAPQGR